MKTKGWSLLKILFLMLSVQWIAYGQNSKPKGKNESENLAVSLYKDAYLSCKYDFFICDSLTKYQQSYITTLEMLTNTQQSRIQKFEAVLYRHNKKIRPLRLFFYWKRHRKNF